MGASQSVSRTKGLNETRSELPDYEDVTIRDLKRKLSAVYPHKHENEIQEEAEVLSNWESLKEKYFAHLLPQAVKRSVDEAFQEAEGFHPRNPADKVASSERLEFGQTRVDRLQIRLVWYEMKDDRRQAVAQKLYRYCPNSEKYFPYGPFHTALQIGNMVIDWDESSVIIPYEAERVPFLVGNPRQAEVREAAEADPGHEDNDDVLLRGVDVAAEGFNYHVNKLLDLAEEKEVMINEVCSLIVKYNTKYHYGLFTCNCHHFAQDVLEVLGLHKTRHAEMFKGKTKVFAGIVTKRGESNLVPEFNSHAELDNHVRREVSNMSLEELQFCYLHYLNFHCWSDKFPTREAWRCARETCKMQEVEIHLSVH